MRIVALVLALAFAMAPPAAALEKMRLADAQLIALEPQRFVLRIQSTGPQAFDVVKSVAQGPGKVRVRLYRAALGELPEIERGRFGKVRFVSERQHVLMVLTLARGYRAQVRQGGNQHVVEVRIER